MSHGVPEVAPLKITSILIFGFSSSTRAWAPKRLLLVISDFGFLIFVLDIRIWNYGLKKLYQFKNIYKISLPLICEYYYIIFELIIAHVTKRKNERLNRRKDILLKKSHEIVIFCDANIVLFIRFRKTNRFIIYKSIDLESWPPSKEQIASISRLI
jgi:hypothetical protein